MYSTMHPQDAIFAPSTAQVNTYQWPTEDPIASDLLSQVSF